MAEVACPHVLVIPGGGEHRCGRPLDAHQVHIDTAGLFVWTDDGRAHPGEFGRPGPAGWLVVEGFDCIDTQGRPS